MFQPPLRRPTSSSCQSSTQMDPGERISRWADSYNTKSQLVLFNTPVGRLRTRPHCQHLLGSDCSALEREFERAQVDWKLLLSRDSKRNWGLWHLPSHSQSVDSKRPTPQWRLETNVNQWCLQLQLCDLLQRIQKYLPNLGNGTLSSTTKINKTSLFYASKLTAFL